MVFSVSLCFFTSAYNTVLEFWSKMNLETENFYDSYIYCSVRECRLCILCVLCPQSSQFVPKKRCKKASYKETITK